MNDVVIVKGQGGLGRVLPGQDFISGKIFYCANGSLPSGFSTSNRVQQINSLRDAVNLGILNDFSDETQATGTVTLAGTQTAGDVIDVKVLEWNKTVDLGAYKLTSADATTVTTAAAAYVLNINLGTSVHGYKATNLAGVITITARKGTGIFLNTGTPISVTEVGTGTATVSAQFSGGVASLWAVQYYHISEYFRMQPNGTLWLGYFAVPGTFNGAELQTLVDFPAVNGSLRQVMVYYTAAAFSTAQVTALQTYATICENNHRPVQVVYAPDISGTTNLATLGDLSGLNSKNVSVCIGQDGAANGNDLYQATGKSITNAGNLLGCVSFSQVSEDIADVGVYNITDGTENAVPAFSNGTLFANTSVSLQNQLNVYRYIFCRAFTDYPQGGAPGTFWNDSHCAILQSSDYAFIENNRTIDKVVRLLRPAYLPFLNSNIDLNSDGTLTIAQVVILQTAGDNALSGMLVPGINGVKELSAQKTTVDPTQNIISTGKLVVAEQLLGQAIARGITLNIGYVKKIS